MITNNPGRRPRPAILKKVQFFSSRRLGTDSQSGLLGGQIAAAPQARDLFPSWTLQYPEGV